jgi:hypothetical protein
MTAIRSAALANRIAKIPLARTVKRFLTRALQPLIRLLNRSDLRIIENFAPFCPGSAGSDRMRASLTILSAQQTFPFLVDFLRATGREVPALIEAEDFEPDQAASSAAAALKSLFDRYGSDKAAAHNYHLIYRHILPRPDEIEAMLEIGLGTNHVDVASHMGRDGRPGASLRAFRDYLPRAQVFGADIDRRILFAEDRIETFFVDQTQPASVAALAAQLPAELDLIIDDGLHSPNANIAVLTMALSKVKVGGWVVIEDIDRAALPIWQAVAATMPGNYECALINTARALMFTARRIT